MYENNSCIYIGNIGKDPDMKSLKNGSDIVTTSLAVRQTKDKTMWLNLSAFGSIGASLMKAVKGDKVKVYGETWTRSYNDKNGVEKVSVDFNLKGIEIEKKKDSVEEAGTPSQPADPFANKSIVDSVPF